MLNWLLPWGDTYEQAGYSISRKRDHRKLLRERDCLKRVREKQELEVTSRIIACFAEKMGSYSPTFRAVEAPESGALKGAHTLLRMGIKARDRKDPEPPLQARPQLSVSEIPGCDHSFLFFLLFLWPLFLKQILLTLIQTIFFISLYQSAHINQCSQISHSVMVNQLPETEIFIHIFTFKSFPGWTDKSVSLYQIDRKDLFFNSRKLAINVICWVKF